ncbi:type I polyketide synthase [Nocardia cyriacigeorgica]|uniref:type I polyketide synthase n=1 Tax=Nocardia cyriacigeorgica TaxID=135487 RepID=UPI002457FF90|nr:beta-ketoacyl synthase N-terminal-like domain-containing protein [Nocardia cyriacigeorgica]
MNDADEQRYRTQLVKAASALRTMEAELARLRRQHSEPIAVIGMGCRFPGDADDPEEFWSLLRDGVDTVSERPGRTAGDQGATGAFLAAVDGFDGAFFGISPQEADALDPQHRLLLEVGWEALEDAGVVTERLAGSRTGVFTGLSGNDYLLLSARSGAMSGYTGTGTAHSFGAGRLSYLLGLRGPSLAVDTACSSSLVAVHLAIRSLRSGECSLALAGGVNLVLDESVTEMITDLQALSPDGRCRSFDARANGFVRGEGCGIVVLKRLSDALTDGDRVLAVLRGSAMNSDGRSAGLTAPNPVAQQDMLRQALADAQVAPSAIGYIETHGTGTALGDPVEIEALAEVFGGREPDSGRCVLGAVKTNIGHLEAAAGIAGLIKTVQALRHREIPRNLHFSTLNPRISLTGTPFVIPTASVAWPEGEKPRIAGVSSFGMSGTNAHVVVAEAPTPVERVQPSEGPVLLPVSARSPAALAELATAYADRLRHGGDLHDIAYSAGARRDHHQFRTAVVGTSGLESAEQLDTFVRGGVPSPRAAVPPRLTYVFCGQGAQWIGMCRELQASVPVFRAALEECERLIARHTSISVLAELAAPEAESRLDRTEIAQPVLFACQIALTALLSSWGIRPDAVIGHSVGELAAAHVAGALSLAEAIRIVVARARTMERADSSGAMVAVALPPDELATVIDAGGTSVAVAAINDNNSVVLSGRADDVNATVDELRRRGIRHRWIPVGYAFHSPSTAPPAAELAKEFAVVECGPTGCPIYSSVRGDRVAGEELTAAYWTDNVRHPVRFAAAVHAAARDGQQIFLEIAPHSVLSGHIAQCLGAPAAVPTLRRKRPELRSMLEATAALYIAGYPVDFARLYPEPRPVVSLPHYRWQRARHWLDTPVRPTEQINPARARWTDELTGLPADDRACVIEAAVRSDVATLLQLPSASDVPVDGKFMDLGLDSLMAVQLRHELAARTGLALPATLAFEHTTPRAVARYLSQVLAEDSEDSL